MQAEKRRKSEKKAEKPKAKLIEIESSEQSDSENEI